MSSLILPSLISAGICDISVRHKNCTQTPLRKPSSFEIELPTEDGGASCIGAESYPIRTDHLICAKPGCIRSTRLPYSCYFVHLSVEPNTPLSEYLSAVPDYLPIRNRERYQALFSDIIRAFAFPSPGSDIYLGSKLLELIHMAYRENLPADADSGIQNQAIADAAAYIDNHCCEAIRLSDVAAAVHLSPVYFHGLFSRIMGQSPGEYIAARRLNTAKRLLVTTMLPITEVAFRSGFSSQSYFGRVFRQQTGVTPLQYRRQAYSRYPE